MENPYMISTTVKYSDGSETVVNYNQNGEQAEIESAVAEALTETSPEAPEEVSPETDAAPAEEAAPEATE